MKKLIIAAIIGLVIDGVGTIVNYAYYLKNNYLLLSIRSWGGECMSESGFGAKVFHIYGMMDGDVTTHNFSFSILSFLLFFVLIWLVVWVVLALCGKIQALRK
ncbi:MAG: hypothetical protein IJ091_01000 [Oscillospiraceae bacterium]|nr:hypothetical protein [Oscillospiraceae bacterium]